MKGILPRAALAVLSLLAAAPALAQVAAGDSEADEAPVAEKASAEAKVKVESVKFLSADGKNMINGYVFTAEGGTGRKPAIVMEHGRGGAYSSLADGVYNADTLSSRHKMWGRLWARRGYVAIMVDDFGPLGYPQGFGRFTYNSRPAELDEVTNRPLHAYGALKYLKTRSDVDPRRIGLMGWSNGGSLTLAAMANDKPEGIKAAGFQAGVAFYPGCGLKNRFDRTGYKPYNPVLLMIGTGDAEVSPTLCERLVSHSRSSKGDIEIVLYKDAEHSFDTPTKSRQSVPANAAAKDDAIARTLSFFDEKLKPRP
ncbi:dienelactone hydrolase family protein [Sphingomonas sp. KR3-1]|uniref:dienelactone hydrolase family protein n=1 Tax=Sphingomonas sp. KR3-1 TaxID=3156611 RepID=UPI0032B34BAD